jgi:ectoine hydroxylase-related dioxygenase (phytanoyl-CoA dioxygenase family)
MNHSLPATQAKSPLSLVPQSRRQAPAAAGASPFKPNVSGREIENIELEAGDLLIWNSLLAHGVRPNRSRDQVRMAQYISMFPADFKNERLDKRESRPGRSRRIRSAIPLPAIRENLKGSISRLPRSIRWDANFRVSIVGVDVSNQIAHRRHRRAEIGSVNGNAH